MGEHLGSSTNVNLANSDGLYILNFDITTLNDNHHQLPSDSRCHSMKPSTPRYRWHPDKPCVGRLARLMSPFVSGWTPGETPTLLKEVEPD